MKCKHCKSDKTEWRGLRHGRKSARKRLFCQECRRWSSFSLDELTPVLYEPMPPPPKFTKKTFLITSAQNNTGVDKNFWKAVLNLKAHYDAELLVIPVSYRNPNMPGVEQEDAWWPKEVIPYLVDQDVSLAPGIRVMGNIKIGATVDNPLSGLDSISTGDSAVFGHAQVQLKTVATPQQRLPKILTTTGSVSLKNYSQARTGVKAEFHHSLGLVVVELDGKDIFHIRNIVGDEKSEFYDLDLKVTARGVKAGHRSEALVVGDEHTMFTCPKVKKATFTDPDSIVNVLKPKYIVRHDVIDSYTVSHHHKTKPSIQFAKYTHKKNRLIDELDLTARYLEETTPKGSTSVIVPSNHHDHITRWLEEVDWREEPWNAILYHEMWAAWLKRIEASLKFHPFTWWLRNNCKADLITLYDDYPFIVKGIYVGYHGNKGINGAKGSLVQFSKIGVKTIIAHWHAPGINKGAYQVGTSTKLALEYTNGPSSWLNSHCTISPNGKRQIINIIKGRWRRERGNKQDNQGVCKNNRKRQEVVS